MHRDWYDNAMNKMSEACEERNKCIGWHQTISGSTIRATLSQQFTLNARKFTIGWNSTMLLVGVGDTNKQFNIDASNPDKSLEDALNFIKYNS